MREKNGKKEKDYCLKEYRCQRWSRTMHLRRNQPNQQMRPRRRQSLRWMLRLLDPVRRSKLPSRDRNQRNS